MISKETKIHNTGRIIKEEQGKLLTEIVQMIILQIVIIGSRMGAYLSPLLQTRIGGALNWALVQNDSAVKVKPTGPPPQIHSSPYSTLGDVWRAYDASIRKVDEEVGKFTRWFKKNDKWSDTFIILTSDHGENLGIRHPLYFNHGGFYDSVLHTPLIIHHPMLQKAEVKELVSHVDIMPTILDMLNVRMTKNIDGKSLLSAVRGEHDSAHNAIFAQKRDLRAIRTKDYKLIKVLNPENFEKEIFQYNEDGIELYNLGEDPNEMDNIADEKPLVASRLEEKINEEETELRTKYEKSRIMHKFRRR